MAAVPQPFGGDITLYSATQIPHILKIMVALTLGIPEHQVRVVAPAVGGGFGSKLNVYAEELICTSPSPASCGVPVRWVEERTENAAGHDPGPRADPEHRARRRRATARSPQSGSISSPTWARTCSWSRRASRCSARSSTHGVYDVPTLLVQLHRRVHDDDADRRLPRRRAARGDLRDRASDGRARGEDRHRSRPSSVVATNQGTTVPVHRDDRPAVRLAATTRARSPRRSSCATTTDGGPSRRAAGRPARRSTSGSASRPTSRCAGWLRAACSPRSTTRRGGWEAATVRVLPTNKVQVVTGASPHGQGHETSWSMIVADKLGVDPDDVDVLHSDTAISPLGLDTYGSRSLAVGGIADRDGGRQGHRQGPHDRCPPARVRRGRPRVRRPARSA